MGGREGGAEAKRLSFLFSVCGGEGLVELFIYSFIYLFVYSFHLSIHLVYLFISYLTFFFFCFVRLPLGGYPLRNAGMRIEV